METIAKFIYKFINSVMMIVRWMKYTKSHPCTQIGQISSQFIRNTHEHTCRDAYPRIACGYVLDFNYQKYKHITDTNAPALVYSRSLSLCKKANFLGISFDKKTSVIFYNATNSNLNQTEWLIFGCQDMMWIDSSRCAWRVSSMVINENNMRSHILF